MIPVLDTQVASSGPQRPWSLTESPCLGQSERIMPDDDQNSSVRLEEWIAFNLLVEKWDATRFLRFSESAASGRNDPIELISKPLLLRDKMGLSYV